MKLTFTFLIKLFLLHDRKVKTKVWISWKQKELLRWNKKLFFYHFKRAFFEAKNIYMFFCKVRIWLESILTEKYMKLVLVCIDIKIYNKQKQSCREVFSKKGVLRNFSKFTGKHLCQNLFLSPQAYNFI